MFGIIFNHLKEKSFQLKFKVLHVPTKQRDDIKFNCRHI